MTANTGRAHPCPVWWDRRMDLTDATRRMHTVWQ